MGTTGAPWNIPYVEPADLVRAYPAADEAQALAVAAGLDNASKLKQIISTTKTDVFSASVASGAISGDVTGLTVTITPTTVASKILLVCSASLSTSGDQRFSYLFYRDGSVLTGSTGDAAGNRVRVTGGGENTTERSVATMTQHYLDSPATTSAVTYSLRLHNGRDTSTTMYVNRSSTDGTDLNTRVRSASMITAIEVTA